MATRVTFFKSDFIAWQHHTSRVVLATTTTRAAATRAQAQQEKHYQEYFQQEYQEKSSKANDDGMATRRVTFFKSDFIAWQQNDLQDLPCHFQAAWQEHDWHVHILSSCEAVFLISLTPYFCSPYLFMAKRHLPLDQGVCVNVFHCTVHIFVAHFLSTLLLCIVGCATELQLNFIILLIKQVRA
jgi:hypothetical protein